MPVQIHRRETRTSGGVQIKGKLRLRPGATVIRIACSLARVDCYTAFALRLPSKARRGQSACPTSALGPFPDFSASRTICALPQQTPSECSTSEHARSGLCKQNGRPGQSTAWSDIPSSSAQRPRLRRRFPLAGNSAGRDRIHRVLDGGVCEAVAAFPALKRAELKALRAGRSPQQHHAAFAFRTSGPADRKQARFGTCM
jgi:hypothetical protein